MDAVRIAVGPDGNAWIITRNYQLYRWLENRWQQFPGAVTDVAVSPDASVWVVGTPADAMDDGYPVWRWNGSAWEQVEAAVVRIAVGPDGLPWAINARRCIYHLT